jgi:pyruvate,water dikinase
MTAPDAVLPVPAADAPAVVTDPGDPAGCDPAVVGGKAAALARAVAAGFDVPPFLVLTDAAFAGADLIAPPHPAPLGPGPYAVRSSARSEDGATMSHAGQFLSLLGVAAADLPAAIARVRASGGAAHLEAYRALHGASGSELPAVIVQAMVPARAAGVAFSADPVSGLRTRTIVAATAGTGEDLVSGEVDGERWVLTPGGTVLDQPAEPVLSPEDAARVAALARAAEAAFGAPQDIEWALDDGGLRLLQSRPVTTPLRPLPAPDSTMVVLDNSNIIESYPGLVSPLTYTFAIFVYERVYRAFVRLLGVPAATVEANAPVFANLLCRVDGRVYYNLGNWYRALALLPGFSLNRAHMETMMGVKDPLPAALADTIGPAQATGWGRLREGLRLLPVALGLGWAAWRLPRTKARFEARLEAALTSAPDLATANLTELVATWRRIEGDLLDRWDAPLVNDFLCMMTFGASRKALERAAGPAGLALHTDLMIGQGDIVSAEPARRIASLAATMRQTGLVEADWSTLADHPATGPEIAAYLARFGDRCTEELKLESITLHDDPAPLHHALQAAARRPAAPPVAAPVPDWTAVLPGRPLRRALLRRLSLYAAARVRDRENLRFERTRIFGLARRVFLAMGRELHARGALDAPRDIFELTVPEILGVVEGAALSCDLRSLVSLRKRETEAAATRPDPGERLVIHGPARLDDGARAPAARPETTGLRRTGTGCSAGRITARARVIRDPRQGRLEPGEILVATHTDPGWIPVFSNAGALLVERGSLLSHSAIVARELGIPCVVGVADATAWVPDGATLTLDGATGAVEIHGPEAAPDA